MRALCGGLWVSMCGLVVLGVAGCGGDEEGPVDLAVETFNLGLAGAFIPYEAERRQPIADALAASEADLVCLQEVWRQSDKDLIAEAVQASFPYVVSFEHGPATPIDDATDQNGEVPPAYTDPPCGSADLQTALDEALECLVANCSTEPDSEQGLTTSTDCASASCFGQVSTLVLGDAAALRCYGCLATSLPIETFADIRTLCTTEVDAGLAFRGQSGVMILSRHPVTASDDIVLPGTWNRRVIATATVDVPGPATVDVYCNHLTPIFDSLSFPYTGQYGDPDDILAGSWEAEQLLQAGKLIDHVEELTGDGIALILGDFNASRAYTVDGVAVTNDEGAATLDLLESAFTPAVAAGYDPACTFCNDNTNTRGTDDVWIDHIFLYNLDATAVLSTARTHAEPEVAVEGDPALVPLSDHYGFSSVIRLEP